MKTYINKKVMLALAILLIGSITSEKNHFAFAGASNAQLSAASQMKKASIRELDNDSRVFKVDSSIEVKDVRFQNRYGIDVAAHMYLPKNFDIRKEYRAIVVSGPFGAVKEQSSGLYAQEMAKQGYVAIAFDQSFTGESSGNVRDVASPDIYTEDFSAAVDFVGSLQFVDKNKIGAIGICGLSGPAITAAINDIRIKAVAVSAMYDMSKSIRDHYQGDYYTVEKREKVKEYLANMRWKEALVGNFIPGAHEIAVDENGNALTFEKMFPEKLPDKVDSVTKEFFDYYRGRAYHTRSINSAGAWDATTPYGFFNFPLMSNIEELSPRPLLLITGNKAHSKYFSEDVYSAAKSPKEIIVVPNATHTDLYDQMDKIPFSRLEKFFDDALK